MKHGGLKMKFVEVFIVIKEVDKNDIAECVKVIKDSFITVANDFGFTVENAPRFTAFATTEDRLNWHLLGEHRPMYAFNVAKDLGCVKINIGIVEENEVLKKWYESFGFVHTGTQKFDYFPFTCGYMERNL